MKLLFAIAVALLLTGCSKDTIYEEPASRYGLLFKLWSEPNSGSVLDMRDARFGQVPYTVVSNGTTCECKLLVGGFIEFGDVEVRMCAHNFASHPDCDAANKKYEYTLIEYRKMDLCEITQYACVTDPSGICTVRTCQEYL